MSVEPLHVQDSRRPVINLLARPDLEGNWSLELQVVFLDGRKVKKQCTGTGSTAAGIVAGMLEMLQEANEAGMPDLPVASVALWTAATSEAEQQN